jgi:hypothetical protein
MKRPLTAHQYKISGDTAFNECVCQIAHDALGASASQRCDEDGNINATDNACVFLIRRDGVLSGSYRSSTH